MKSQDNWSSHWQQFADSASLNPAQRMRHEFIVRLLEDRKGDRAIKLLDIGSGQGDLLQKLSQRIPDGEFLGIELSESGVEIARSKVPQAEFIAADLFIPPPALLANYNRWATHATCSEVLEHVDDPVAFLKSARQYLTDDAVLFVTVPGGRISAFDRYIGHRQHFTRRSLQVVLERAGFQVEKIYLAGFPFFNLYRLVVIVRGEKLIDDAKPQQQRRSRMIAHTAMRAFELLFRFNLMDSPFGWQVVAVARKCKALHL